MELNVLVVQLTVLLGFPEPAQGEIAQHFVTWIGVRGTPHHGQEQLSCRFKAGRTGRDVDKTERGQCRKQAAVGQEMSLKTGKRYQARIDKGEGDHRRKRKVR